MSDDTYWIKVKSKLPRPTNEEQTRPLRLFWQASDADWPNEPIALADFDEEET